MIAHQGQWLGGGVFVFFDRQAVALLRDQGVATHMGRKQAWPVAVSPGLQLPQLIGPAKCAVAALLTGPDHLLDRQRGEQGVPAGPITRLEPRPVAAG